MNLIVSGWSGISELYFAGDWLVEPSATLQLTNPLTAPHGGNLVRASSFTVQPLRITAAPNPRDWLVVSLQVAQREQLLPTTGVPLAILMGGDLMLPRQHAGQSISIAVENVSKSSLHFSCVMLGSFPDAQV